MRLHPETVAKWSRIDQYCRPPQPKRGSRLDSYKGQIVRWLDTHRYSAQHIFQRAREAGFADGLTIVKNCVRQIRPPRQKAFLKLSFAAGEAAQVDWGEYGTIARRRHTPQALLLRDGVVLFAADVSKASQRVLNMPGQ
jgi:transposase